jgi:zinc protease
MLNMRLQELAQQADPPFSEAGNYNYNMVRSKSNYSLVASVPEDGIVRGMTTLLTEAERVKRFGFTQSEFDRTKQMMLRSAERQLAEKDTQDSKRMVYRYIGNFAYGNPIMSIEQNVALNRELYAGITLNDVNQVSRELITDDNLVIVVNAPQKEGLVLPTEDTLLGLFTQVKAAELTPYQDVMSAEDLITENLLPGKVTAARDYAKPGIKEWTLNNGIRVLFKPTTFKNDEVMLKGFSPGGTSLYDQKDLFDAREAAGIIIDSGVKSFDAVTLEKKLSGKIVHVTPYINSTEEGFTGNCSKADLETMFQLIYLYATAPRLDEKSYANWLSRTTAAMQNEVLNPEASYSDSVYSVLYDRNPRVQNMTVDDLKTLDMNRILQIYKERFADFSDFTFVVVGSFDEKQLKDYCLKYLANLPSHGIKEKVKDQGVRYAKGKREIDIYKGQAEKSTVQFIIAGDCKIDSNTRNTIRNLSDLMDEKLRENIREARSGVYYIGAYDNIRKYPNPTYQVTVYMQCDPNRVEELSAAVIGTLDSLKAGKIADKYVNQVKITRQKKLETDMSENPWWMTSIYDRVWNKYPLDDIMNDKKAIDNINLKQLQNSAKLYLKQDSNLVRGILYPISKANELKTPE